ncbi:hypothetical protein CIG75_03230 [Tumebacillus algifaecis]|uniref:Iminophenyl-pyruvate dimer synthase domain-containing protein n=1 Tax=Tumebacillus algifaecis TaxID=1214604 RepID=A0A223CXY4_9BACL|nr:ferritin-like domain-containing protein [Tumebacillus algifaecis]ASS74095.1 hypothetical protein CIG75_03230 [Tumebacillus algifaecis]
MSENQNHEARSLLVALLHEAAELEHSLLDAYLYTACSIKSTPQEFAVVGGKENRRRAVQFERARSWKQSILLVAHEEMLHLHYVQCLLRALGEAPRFGLPNRSQESGNWQIPNWKAQVAGEDVDGGTGVEVPIGPLSLENIRRFVLYEATDSLQDENPFGEQSTLLFKRLHHFELEYRFESMLYHIENAARRAELKQKLYDLYTLLTPLAPEDRHVEERLFAAMKQVGLPAVEELRFQSIADFYLRGILPLYQQAFDFNWVKHDNRDLNNEMLDTNYAAEGFLPIGPVNRDMNFNHFARGNLENPLQNYKHVENIIKEIVEEGEGASHFESNAEAFLQQVDKIGGVRNYLTKVLRDPNRRKPSTPIVQLGERLRKSHLYRFALIMTELEQEQELARESGLEFSASREPLAVEDNVRLKQITSELPAQFNATYLVMLAWLSRMYEIPHWEADKPRRLAIEMLASWPLMSLAIRPFLELASFFPIDLHDLYRLDPTALPLLPIHAQQLHQVYAMAERSEAINARMDYLAVRVLSDVAKWAEAQKAALAGIALDDHTKDMLLSRLTILSQLDEFQKQFPFRVHGGYSNKMPDLTYQQKHPDSGRYEEDPTAVPALFEETLALRIRFSGWGLVQMATDPDPPSDEVGASGTHMMHASDGNKRFDRALVWQNNDKQHDIVRGPHHDLPELGVNAQEVSLVVTNGTANAGFVPLQVMNSLGAVQTSGVQQELRVDGFFDLLNLTPQDILGDNRKLRIDLLEKNGQKPFLNGQNHLVWKDGEPIDPFILALFADPKPGAQTDDPKLLFKREIFNQGLTMMEMEPLQRISTSRGPCGFDDVHNIPPWVMGAMPEKDRKLFECPGYPMSYLVNRSRKLGQALEQQFQGSVDSQSTVDQAVSLAERMRLINVPRMETMIWLNFLLHYGHTVSGHLAQGDGENPILTALAQKTNLQLSLAESDQRDAANSRWLVKYTKGVMDTDAIRDLVFGEMYIPIHVQASTEPIELTRSWSFPLAMQKLVTDFACHFDSPFWAAYKVSKDGKSRTLKLPNKTEITETLLKKNGDSHSYAMTGLEGVSAYTASFTVSKPKRGDEQFTLNWKISFHASTPQAILATVTHFGNACQQMTDSMTGYFAPTVQR